MKQSVKMWKLEKDVHNFHIKGNGTLTLSIEDNYSFMVTKGEVKISSFNNVSNYRYYCDCDSILSISDQYRYDRQVVVELPFMIDEKVQREKEGLRTTVCIDSCIVKVIKELWSIGIKTMGCCCGHNNERGWVNVHPKDYERMFSLGYEQRPVEVINKSVMGLYTFYL